VRRRWPGLWGRIYLSGFSLGANVIMNFLGTEVSTHASEFYSDTVPPVIICVCACDDASTEQHSTVYACDKEGTTLTRH
jgi:predicted alpha/beta-fold hydrolase